MDEDGGAVIVPDLHGNIAIRKARKKRQKLLAREIFYDYANNTTLHGLSYTTKKELTLIEKTFWLVTFIASLCICAYQIQNVFIKWKTSPVIVSFSEHLVPVSKVPFPAVTICPQVKIRPWLYNYTTANIKYNKFRSKFEDNPENTTLVDDDDFNVYEDISMVCNPKKEEFYYEYQNMPRNQPNFSTVDNIVQTAPKLDDLLWTWSWRGVKSYFDSDEDYGEVLTSEGVCFTINTLAADEILRRENVHVEHPHFTARKPTKHWDVEHGFSAYGPDTYPAQGKDEGATPDLSITFWDFPDYHDALCNNLNSGFKIYIHHPADLPRSSLYYYAVLNKQVSSMALSFSILNTSETLRNYDPEIRQCYFNDERYLRYFKIYTASNCKIECLTNYTYARCGCVAFYMPFATKNATCKLRDLNCVIEAQEAFLPGHTNSTVEKSCLCLPACNTIDYDAEILKTDFKLKESLVADAKVRNRTSVFQDEGDFSKLEMYFKRSQFVSMHRSELFGLTDFLANIGGLLGLFLGFSFLSLVELFYFATLRLFCTLKKDLQEEKIQRRRTQKRK
ncbi:pickpocket protein 28-like [Anticarsia gemmatalis]|uniref:pickpocket protein 28-like n=1 Tax=Anticarsia gemmatalis TaxID=129554 RepID=UPI003F76FAB8